MVYPTTVQLDAFLTAVGISHGGWDMAAAVAAGIARWEDLTDWHPFLFTGAGADAYFPVQNARRFRIPNTGLVAYTSLELAGKTLSADQYVVHPLNRLPIQVFDFLVYVNTYFMIRGAKLGYTESITQAQFDDILILMAMMAVSMHTSGGSVTMGTAKEKVGSIEKWYMTLEEAGLAEQVQFQGWGPRVLAATKALRRKVIR